MNQPYERQVLVTDLCGNQIYHMERALISRVIHHEDGTVTFTARELSPKLKLPNLTKFPNTPEDDSS
jgi:hypothetical protein